MSIFSKKIRKKSLQISFDEPKMSLLAFVIAKQFHAPKLSQTSLATWLKINFSDILKLKFFADKKLWISGKFCVL